MKRKQSTTIFMGLFLTLFIAAFMISFNVKAESVIGLPGDYHVNTQAGTRSEMNIGINEPGQIVPGVTDSVTDIQLDKPGDVRLSFDVYVPTKVFDKMAETDQCFQIQPIEYIRIPGKQWYSFFGYTIGVKKTSNGMECFSFANHYTNADVDDIKTDNPDYVKITSGETYTKISVTNEPIDTNGARCFDIEEDKEYEGSEAIGHFQPGAYKVFCPIICIFQGGNHLYTDDVDYLLTGQAVSAKGTEIYRADYTRENPVGYYTTGLGNDENAEFLYSVTWDIPSPALPINNVKVNVTAPSFLFLKQP